MKKLLILSLLLFPLAVQADVYELDTTQSQIEWLGKKVTGKHNGLLKIKNGKVNLEGKKIAGGEFEIDMSTIEVVDIQDPQKNAKLKNHLKSEDFFHVKQFPVAKFVITRTEHEGPGKVAVTGNLTIKGITHPVTIPATLTEKGNTLEATGQVSLDRTKWNVRYGSGKFFKGLGDKVISDNFDLKLKLIAKK